MGKWYYYDNWGFKQGPISDQELRFNVVQQKIMPDTLLESAENGRQGRACEIQGLFPNGPQIRRETAQKTNPVPQPNPMPQAAPMPQPNPAVRPAPARMPAPTAASMMKYCTNCGQTIIDNAVVCMNCGASPKTGRNFCRECGTRLNPAQVFCLHCGASVKSQSGKDKNKIAAGLLAIFLGGLGIHKFYLGNTRMGLLYLLTTLLSPIFAILLAALTIAIPPFIILAIAFWVLLAVPQIVGFIEGIIYLCSSDETFQEKYVH